MHPEGSMFVVLVVHLQRGHSTWRGVRGVYLKGSIGFYDKGLVILAYGFAFRVGYLGFRGFGCRV